MKFHDKPSPNLHDIEGEGGTPKIPEPISGWDVNQLRVQIPAFIPGNQETTARHQPSLRQHVKHVVPDVFLLVSATNGPGASGKPYLMVKIHGTAPKKVG